MKVNDREEFVKIRYALGGEVTHIICGGAPLSKEVKEFLRQAFHSFVFEAYGSTETGGALTTSAGWDENYGT